MKWRVEKSGGADEGRQPLNILHFNIGFQRKPEKNLYLDKKWETWS